MPRPTVAAELCYLALRYEARHDPAPLRHWCALPPYRIDHRQTLQIFRPAIFQEWRMGKPRDAIAHAALRVVSVSRSRGRGG